MRTDSLSQQSITHALQPRHFNFLSYFALFLLILTVLQTPIAFVHAPPQPTVRQVPSASYPTIQSAIDLSGRGDIVQVAPGTYYEHLTVLVAQLIIRGENKETTIIDADTTGTAITLGASSITITGFTMRNGGYNSGIQTYNFGSHNISNNIIENFIEGVYFSDSDSNIISGNTFFNNSMHAVNLGVSSGSQIYNNIISESAFGLNLIYVDGTMIMRNIISNTSYAIFIDHSSQSTIKGNTCQLSSVGIQTQLSDHLTISDNIISGSMYSLQFQKTHYSQISNNSLTEGSYGLYLVHSNGNTIVGSPSLGNLIAKNDWGLVLYNSTGNMIIDGNTIAHNTWGIYIAANSNGNTIYHNNFITNVRQAYQDIELTNFWQNGQPEGNYWDDYTGYPPAAGVDSYPLPDPWPLRNIATTIVTVSSTLAYPGDIITINATVKNFGVITETFKVTAYFNSTLIETQTTTLTPGSTAKLTYNWNTTNVPPNHYVVSVTAGPIPYIESDYADNSLNEGPVTIAFQGDCDVDGDVDYDDFVILAAAYGSTNGQPSYNPAADLDDDGDVDYDDFVILAADYGKHM